MKYQKFIFKDYGFDAVSKSLKLNYSFDNVLDFTETYTFDFDFVDYDELLLDRAIQNLFFLAGVSYFKIYPFAEIKVESGLIDEQSASFFSKTYQRGLGEFFYVNDLDPNLSIKFPVNSETLSLPDKTIYGETKLIGIGGGKDSLVTVELLKNSDKKLATFSLNHREKLEPLINRIGLPFFYVDRQWDKKIIDLNKQGAYNGHIPISAIIAAVGNIIGVLTGNSDVIVSNENSANEPTLTYRDVAINHQYSKSIEFEKDWQEQLRRTMGENTRYYSALRPFSEMSIAKTFSHVGFQKYKDVFSSCNSAFTHYTDKLFWDGTCPKCAFVFLVLTPFIAKDELEKLFSGKNLLQDSSLEATYRQLLGIDGSKPLECVGEIKESRLAMQMAGIIYPELRDKYKFDLPEDYDFNYLNPHSMPEDIYRIITASI